MKVVKLLRAHVGVAAVSAAVILGGAGAATAVVATSADSPVVEEPGAPVVEEPAAETAQTTAPAGTTEAPAPVLADAPAPVTTAPVAPGEPVQAATVDDVAPSPQVPAPQPDPGQLPADQDMSGVGSVGPDGNYTAAPPVQHPGEPPVGPGFLEGSGATAVPMPGEPGYVPPAG